MVTREITVSELIFLREVLESFLEEDINIVDTGQAIELVDKLIKRNPNVQEICEQETVA